MRISQRLFNIYANYKFRPRLFAIEKRISRFFNTSVSLRPCLRKSPHDSIYNVISRHKVIAVARIRNEFLLRFRLKKNSSDWDELLILSAECFKREWEKYQKSSLYSLAPTPLYREDGVLVCKFVDAPTALEITQKDKKSLWFIVERVLEGLKKLHEIEIIHGDAALYNTLIPSDGGTVFIDMEYHVPQIANSLPEQAVFDYLHFLDTTLKFFPTPIRDFGIWLNILQKHIESNLSLGNFNHPEILAKYFPRLSKIDPQLKNLHGIFYK